MAKKGGRLKGEQDQADLKKAQPMNSPDDPGGEGDGGEAERPAEVGTKTNGSPFGKIRDGLSALGNTAGGALASGLRGAAHNWFGFKPLTNMISNMLSGIAADLGIPTKVVAMAISALLAGGVGMGSVAIMNYMNVNFIQRQDTYVDPCGNYSNAERSGLSFDEATGAGVSVDAEKSKNAKMFMGVFANLGLTEAQCKGMLASVIQESGLDPTTLEGVFGGKYQMTDEKKSYFNSDGYSFNQSAVTDKLQRLGVDYASKGIWISPDYHDHSGYYDSIGSQWTIGIGMIQYTGPSAGQLLRFASSTGKRWYDLDLQIAFFLSDESGFAGRLQRMLRDMKNKNLQDNETEACDYWTGYIERGAGKPIDEGRSANLGSLGSLGLDYDRERLQYEAVAKDIASMANTTVSAAMLSHSVNIMKQCNGIDELRNVTNNVQLAELAVDYAYPTTQEGYAIGPQVRGGTDLYLYLRSQVCPSDPYYASCDRSVAVAILASGADRNFPLGGTTLQGEYLLEQHSLPNDDPNKKWTAVGTPTGAYPVTYETVMENQLAPGDVVITIPGGHVAMYVGPEVTANAGRTGEFVSGSIGGPPRYPGTGHTKKVYTHAYDGRQYYVFRYIGTYQDTKADLTM